MDWTASVDAYCERIATDLWAEPVNAATNLAFVIAAAIMWRRGRGAPFARPLAAILFAIGIGSGLFHTFATRWAGLADTAPIAAFVLVYIFAANRLVLRLSPGLSLALAAGFLPWTAALVPLFRAIPGLSVSAVYWPVPALILLYAVVLVRRAPDVARGFTIGAAILILSLTFRSLDGAFCPAFPLGTHFLWHLLNALMLGWMIEVLVRHARRHRLAARGPER